MAQSCKDPKENEFGERAITNFMDGGEGKAPPRLALRILSSEL